MSQLYLGPWFRGKEVLEILIKTEENFFVAFNSVAVHADMMYILFSPCTIDDNILNKWFEPAVSNKIHY